MADYPFHMWKTVCAEYYEYPNALERYYSVELASNQELASAVRDIRKAKRVIDSIMSELADKEIGE